MELKDQLTALQTELKSHFDKAAEEQKLNGTMREETKTAITKLQTQVDAIDTKLADRPNGGTPTIDAFKAAFDENDSVQRLVKDRSGKAVLHFKGDAMREMQRKTVLTENTTGSVGNSQTGVAAGYMTTGVLQIDRIAGITTEARQVLKIRNVLTARPTMLPVVDFVKVLTPMSIASPVAEGSLKPEQALNFSSASERVKTIASYVPASRQILDDMVELMGFVRQSLPYYTNLAEEQQLLSGDGTGENLNGFIHQASAFNTGLLPSAAKGWTKIDVIGCAVEQITIAKETDPTFVVLNPKDWWDIRLTKDGFGRYILGDPQSTVQPNIFGLDVVYTTSIASGTFLVGSGNPIAQEIRDRMEMVVEISTEHLDYFARNLVAIRGEKRLANVVKRPASFISGSFTTSP